MIINEFGIPLFFFVFRLWTGLDLNLDLGLIGLGIGRKRWMMASLIRLVGIRKVVLWSGGKGRNEEKMISDTL
jgi:hypothetical protein